MTKPRTFMDHGYCDFATVQAGAYFCRHSRESGNLPPAETGRGELDSRIRGNDLNSHAVFTEVGVAPCEDGWKTVKKAAQSGREEEGVGKNWRRKYETHLCAKAECQALKELGI